MEQQAAHDMKLRLTHNILFNHLKQIKRTISTLKKWDIQAVTIRHELAMLSEQLDNLIDKI